MTRKAAHSRVGKGEFHP